MLNGPGTTGRGSNTAPSPRGMFHGAFEANGHTRRSRVVTEAGTGGLVAGGAVVDGGVTTADGVLVVEPPTLNVVSSLLFDSFDSVKRFTSSTNACTTCEPLAAAVHVGPALPPMPEIVVLAP